MSSPFWKYFLTMIILYSLYKIGSTLFSNKRELHFWVPWVVWLFLVHLFVVCGIYATMPEWRQMVVPIWSPSGVVLFFHIISLLIYPIVLTLICRTFWLSVLRKVFSNWEEKDMRISVLVEASIGFLIFSVWLLVLGSIGYYTLNWLIVILALMSIWGWNGWKKTYNDIFTKKAIFENHVSWEWFMALVAPRLLSAEFSFFILSLMMSVAMISIIRPMPIWWDDLGVYMNFPKIMALTGELLPGAGMYTWQLITWTWFLIGYNASQAFFINQLWSLLAIIAITLWLSFLFEQKSKKSILALPLILATVYYVMPMTVFHHTKDMKLDPALLFVSISGFMAFFGLIFKDIVKSKEQYKYIVLVWLILWFAFSIKVTTLMLVLSIFWLYAYRTLSFWWYLGFFFVFLSIFTGANLWSIMNVWMPSDKWLLHIISWFLALLWLWSFIICGIKDRKRLTEFVVGSFILLISFFIWLSPWIIKNTTEVKPWNSHTVDTKTVVLQSLLSWSGAWFLPDFSKIMSAEDYDRRTNIIKNTNISSDWQSNNEDFWRYFWYEDWINNYIRLPINLTFQKNQSWEFTSITYIFLALIPVLFLFARWRFPWVYWSIISIALFVLFAYAFLWPSKWSDGSEKYPINWILKNTYSDISNEELKSGISINEAVSVFVKKPILEWLNSIKLWEPITETLSLKWFSKNPLLYGYILILILNIAFIAVIHFLTKNEEEDRNFREMVVVLNVYWFLFLISAFGIVWYGIFVYFIFFALIWLLASRFYQYNSQDTKNENLFAIKVTLSALLFTFIAIYFVRTALPHAWTNLKSAWFNEYKYNVLDQESTLFTYRSDYLIPIATMNLKDTLSLTGVITEIKTPKLKEILTEASKDRSLFLEVVSQIIPQAQKSKDSTLKKDGAYMANYIYNKVLYPKKEDANLGGIYRIGTFMTYLINKNNSRYYDDSLIFWFDGYFYEESPEKTIEKMKKLWFKFLLIDLNAATIDRDPRRVLTQRYEHLLLTMRAKNLKLVNTDNICLQFALDEYNSWKLQSNEEFMDIAGTNYESYRKNWSGEISAIGRWQKQKNCYNAMLKSISQDNWASKYTYLAGIKDAIEKNNANNNPELLSRIMMSYAGQSFFALYEITDTPIEPNGTKAISTQSGRTIQ